MAKRGKPKITDKPISGSVVDRGREIDSVLQGGPRDVIESGQGVVGVTKGMVTQIKRGSHGDMLVIPPFTLVWSREPYEKDSMSTVAHGPEKRFNAMVRDGMMFHRFVTRATDLIVLWVDGRWLVEEGDWFNRELSSAFSGTQS